MIYMHDLQPELYISSEQASVGENIDLMVAKDGTKCSLGKPGSPVLICGENVNVRAEMHPFKKRGRPKGKVLNHPG